MVNTKDKRNKPSVEFLYRMREFYLSHLRLNPIITTIRITSFYLVFGLLWIFFSSKIIYKLTNDISSIKHFEVYKGVLYIFISAAIFSQLIYRGIANYEKAKENIHQNLIEINAAHHEALRLREELGQLACTDTLTSMPNKFAFENKLVQLVEENKDVRSSFTYLYIDIDNFKHINDTVGHDAGDFFLSEFRNQLTEIIKEPNLAARIGGDEFAILLQNSSGGKAEMVISELTDKLRRIWVINDHEFFITFSIGLTVYPTDGITSSKLLQNADMALYQVKGTTKDNFSYYSFDIETINRKRISMINSLRKAVINEEFTLLYQPIKTLTTDTICGAEALIRWNHPNGSVIPPSDFIPIAEESGLILDIDRWVLREALKQKRIWEKSGYPSIKISINLSGHSLRWNGLAAEILNQLTLTGVNADEVLFEVTETSLIENLDTSIELLKSLRQVGVRIALDDFGTGYSSLTYLEKLPIDIVKLDRSFVNEITSKEHTNIIVETMIRLTHDLNLKMTAEGIENDLQRQYLSALNCDFGQGYYFSKPVSSQLLESNWLS